MSYVVPDSDDLSLTESERSEASENGESGAQSSSAEGEDSGDGGGGGGGGGSGGSGWAALEQPASSHPAASSSALSSAAAAASSPNHDRIKGGRKRQRCSSDSEYSPPLRPLVAGGGGTPRGGRSNMMSPRNTMDMSQFWESMTPYFNDLDFETAYKMRRIAENATAFPPELSFRDYDVDLDGRDGGGGGGGGGKSKNRSKFMRRKDALAKAKADVEKRGKAGELSQAGANREHEALELAEDIFLGGVSGKQSTSVHYVDALELIADTYGEEARQKELPDEPDLVVKALLRTSAGCASVTLGSVFCAALSASSSSYSKAKKSKSSPSSNPILVDWEAGVDETPFDNAMSMSMDPAVVVDALRAQVRYSLAEV